MLIESYEKYNIKHNEEKKYALIFTYQAIELSWEPEDVF